MKLNSAEAAQDQIKRWTDEQTELQARIDEHINAEKDAQQNYSSTKGKLEGKEKELPGLKDALAEAAQKADEVLAENGFADEAAAEAVLAPVGDADGEKWLQDQTEAVHDYESDCRNTGERITELEDKTRGKTLTDLAGLDARIAEKQEEQTAADSEYRTADGNYKNHKRIFEKAKEYRTALTSTDSAWQRLDTLGTLATSSGRWRQGRSGKAEGSASTGM